MAVSTGAYSAGVDREVATQDLNRELQDKRVSADINRRHYQLGTNRFAALDDLWSGLLRG